MEKQLTRKGRIGVLLICSMSLLMVGLDVTAVNVALPSIDSDLNASISGLQWTVSAYTVVMASFLMFSGSTADRFGRRRILILGLSVFTLGSLMCGLAPSIGFLIAARVLQALGGSMMNPVAMSIITNTFTDPRERAQAIGIWGAAFGLSMALGPIVGGILVTAFDWRAIFMINIPVGFIAVMLILRYVPESRAAKARRFDPIGQSLMIVLLAAVTFGIIEAPKLGWTSPVILGSFIASGLALLAILFYEPRRDEPLIDLRFFRSVPFSAAVVILISAFAAFGGFLFLSTLYLQEVRDFTPIQAGLATVPLALMTVLSSPLSGRLVGRHGPRPSLLIAGVCLVTACAMLTQIGQDTPIAWLIAAYVIFGTGFGFVNTPATNAAVSGMPRAQAGTASAIATTSRQFGQALGVAVVGAIVTSQVGQSLNSGLASASVPAWWTLTAFGGAVLLFAILATTKWSEGTARTTAIKLNPEAIPE